MKVAGRCVHKLPVSACSAARRPVRSRGLALGKQLAVLVTVGSLTPVPLFAASFSGKAYPLAVPGFVAASFLSPDFLC